MIREEIFDAIFLDDNREGYYDNNWKYNPVSEEYYHYDQACDSFPVVFPTVNFELCATDGLVELADDVRRNAGYKPMVYPNGLLDDDYDLDGWYDFYIDLNGFNKHHIDTSISFVVVNSDEDDNEEMYTIYLTDEEQQYIYDCIDEELRKDDSSCENELKKSADWYKELYGAELTILERRTA